MSAPANDLFANAQLLTGDFGVVTGTNIGSGSEPTEPPNNGSTVWYKFTPSTHQVFVFGTTYNSTIGTVADPVCKTVMQVFLGTSLSDITEVPLNPLSFKQRFGNWELGSQIIFEAEVAASPSLFIRVDGVGGAQGNFGIWWTSYYPNNIGGCSGCPPASGCGIQCVGVIKPTVLSNGTYSFGTIPEGTYFMVWCAGAFNMGPDGLGGSQWSVYQSKASDGEGDHMYYQFDYFKAGSAASFLGADIFGFVDMYNTTNLQPSLSLSLGQFAAFGSCSYQFHHSGGDISVEFNDSNVSDNTDSAQNPTWGLYSFVGLPDIEMAGSSACASWVTPGVSATCTFHVFNNSSYDGAGITATLQTSGGISGSSTATDIVLTRHVATPITLTFDCASSSVIATLVLTVLGGSCGTTTMEFNLAPIITITATSGTTTGPFISGTCLIDTFNYGFKISNAGYWNIGTAAVTLTMDSISPLWVGPVPSCSTTASIVEDTSIGCGSSGIPIFVANRQVIVPMTGGTVSNIHLSVADESGAVVYTNTYPITLH